MKKIQIKPFDREVRLFFSLEDLHEHTKISLEELKKTLGGFYGQVNLMDNSNIIYLFLNWELITQKKSEGFIAACVAHECLHAAKRVLDTLGTESGEATEEVEAYLMDYLVQEVYKRAPRGTLEKC